MENTEDIDILTLLDRLLWSKRNDFHHACPICDENFGKYGHRDYCELAKTMNKLGGQEKIQRNLFDTL